MAVEPIVIAMPAVARDATLAAVLTMRDSEPMTSFDSPALAPELPLDAAMLDALTRSDATSLSAPEIAQAIRPGGDWHALLAPIRQTAIALALEGRLIIYRKGKPADPRTFSGVYRIGLPRQD